MKHKTKLVVLLVLVAGLVVGNSFAKPIAPNLKLGVLLSASGPLWFTAAFERNGLQMAIEDSKDKSLANVSLIFDDAGDSDSEAKAALQRLRARGVDALVSPLDSASAMRIAKLNQEDPLPIIAPSSIEESVTSNAKNKNWLFRLSSTSSQDGGNLATYIAKSQPDQVVIVSDQEDYSKPIAKMLNMGLTLRGIRVQQFAITEFKKIKQTRPDVFVLVSLESALQFFENMSDWVSNVQSGYLVSGNLANYSAYPWAKSITGFRAVVPTDSVPMSFKQALASYMNRPALLNSPNSSMFGLAYRSCQLLSLVASVGKDSRDLRGALASAKNEYGQYFDGAGYYLQQGYAVYRYGSTGTFSQIGWVGPNSP